MPTKVKEIKDDAILEIKVNKTYYLMTKALSFNLFNSIPQEKREATVQGLKEKKYEEMDDVQKSFYTVALLISEIEKQAAATGNLIEKEVSMPGEEGFKMPDGVKINED